MDEEKKDDNITKEELLSLIKSSFQNNIKTPQNTPIQTPPTNNQTIQPIQPVQKTPEPTKQIIAETVMKLHNNIMILCLLIFTIPFITILVAIIDFSIAFIIPMIAIVYPAWLYAQSKKAQYYLSRKYNLKPFMFFKIRINTNKNKKDDIF